MVNKPIYATESGNELVTEFFDMVYRLAYSRTNDKTHAEDVTQEVFLRFLKYEKPFDSKEHVKAWLIRVTVNCSKSVFTTSWYKKTVPLTEDIPFETKEESDIYYAVSELPQKYRTVIHLFYYEDLSVAQIADYLNTNESTIKSRLHRGRELLKTKLKGDYNFV